MTIVKNLTAITYHPFKAIDEDVRSLVEQAAETLRKALNLKSYLINRPLKMLEVYCDLTGQLITMETLRTPEIQCILEDFTVAMAGKSLTDIAEKERLKFCRLLYQCLITARDTQPDLHPLEWDFTQFEADAAICASILEAANDFQIWYWNGWSIHRPDYSSAHLRLAQLVTPYGQDFVQDIFTELEKQYRNRPDLFRIEWNHMFDYMGENAHRWPASTFKTEAGIKQFMQAFGKAHFEYCEAADLDAETHIKNYNRFLNNLEVNLCKTDVWAKLSSPIKRPPPATKHPSQTKIKKTEDGLLVQEKLLTSIPLHVTDVEAVEILFFHIKHDVSIVRRWATSQAEDLKARYTRRVSLAKEGNKIIEHGKKTYRKYSLADICATLESMDNSVPLSFLCKVYTYITGEECSAKQLAHTFGFPVAGSLFPFQCLLVLEHPEITTEFLRSFELYDEHDSLSGFHEAARQLIGYKSRKQPDTREQVIDLNDISFSVVKDLIDITSIGRRKLRSERNDTYRYLFLTSGQSCTSFRLGKTTAWKKSSFNNDSGLRDRLLEQFRPHCDLTDAELLGFFKRIRLTTVRASRAVEIFIQSKSSEEMSKALGHENYYADLLSHYLPDALLAFIKARWIRVFQKAMVCEAMKDSTYLFRVTQFNTMDELDSFLEKHRIQEIPPEASDPERKAQRQEVERTEAILSIGVPFLASLLSLEAAVKASTDRIRVCGKAEFWASIAETVRTEIISGTKGVLKNYLKAALELVDAKKMEGLIYVSGR
ncbi:hypothetical protein RS3R6_08810 [Pseudomonas atacamensis]|uniref:Uncharacterized protein n=1 Tax=Pseudomonas atacamensis TaxID=2565368 RepID=A0ABQ5PMD9_9PSED|nr:hypothetical protein [Pseudomonas atacamensis]GLH44640.1 hypothetical protein RS3R1_37280 [Pseudomonas atacamensis]GLH52700.1 hypothetical protein RS3R6_08810 [Pseudomonas atacamensis]